MNDLPAHGFQTFWERAARLERRGRRDGARRAWVSALRHSLRSGDTSHMRVALDGLDGPARCHSLGPPSTPRMQGPARPSCRVRLETAGDIHALERRHLEGFMRVARLEVLVDVERQQVTCGDRVIPMHGQEIPLRILATLVRRRGERIPDSQLFEEVWGRRFNGQYDSRTIYFNMFRLRKRLGEASSQLATLVLRTRDGYRLMPGLRTALADGIRAHRLTGREMERVMEVASQRGSLTNRDFCAIAGISRSTALRELAELVRLGLLERVGSGRGIRYCPTGSRPPG